MPGPAENTQIAQVGFNILGSFEGWVDGERMRFGGPLQERVLVMLLLDVGRVLPISRLAEAVWDGNPPASAAHQVRKAASDLRQRLPGGSELILTERPGYRIVLDEHQLDVSRFDAGLRRAQQAVAAGLRAEAVEELRGALDLWRGPLMAGTGGTVIAAASTAWEERRLTAAEQYFDLRLGLGETSNLVSDLRDLVNAHPLRESLRSQLMLALHRSGRQAEALDEFARVRALLVEELGIDPGAQLVKLHRDILRGSAELVAPERPSVAVLPALAQPLAETPCTLPHYLPDFTGREQELRWITGFGSRPGGQRPLIAAVDGMGGSGKTSLMVQAAHQLAEHYPDGQLYIDLRGFTQGEQPLQPGTVLDILLRAMGVPGDQIPHDTVGRTALWRSTLTQRRMLLLLDNTFDSAQVRPLLPVFPGSLVLITSRQRLVDLDGAEWMSIGMMPPQDSAALLRTTLGEQRIEAEPEASLELAELCGHLPLALRIAAARLHNRPRWTVRYLVDRLRDRARHLDELNSGERSVTATLWLSYQAMDPEYQSAFQLLGRHPGADIDVYSAAALLGRSARYAENVLEHLLDIHLLLQHEMGVYSFHDLVRSFAQTLREPGDDPAGRTAVERLLDYYVAAVRAACEAAFPGRMALPIELPGSGAELPPMRNADQALAWFDRERGSLLESIRIAEREGLDLHAAYLPREASFYLNVRGAFDEFEQLGQIAVAASRRLGNPLLLQVSLTNLGVARWKIGRFRDGIAVVVEALGCARAAQDGMGQAICLDVLGLLHGAIGELTEAHRYLTEGIALHKDAGYPRHEAEAWANLSSVASWLGRYPEAASAAERAVQINRELGNRSNEITALSNLIVACLGLGENERALVHVDQALTLCDQSQTPENYALILALSADVCQRLGRLERSDRDAEQAVELVRSRGNALRQSAVENIAGRISLRHGRFAQAKELHRSAYQRAQAIEYHVEMARALSGLAQASAALGESTEAGVLEQRANELFAAMGVLTADPGHDLDLDLDLD